MSGWEKPGLVDPLTGGGAVRTERALLFALNLGPGTGKLHRELT